MFSLSSQSVGLDISDSTVEVVALKKNGNKIQVLSKNSMSLAPDIVKHGRIIDADALQQALQKLFSEAAPSPIEHDKIIFGLPESLVYTNAFFVPKTDEKKIQALLPSMVQKAIPLPADDIVFTHTVRRAKEDGVHVTVVATSQAALREWQRFFHKNKYTIEGFDIESFANVRDLLPVPPNSPICVLDIGSKTTLFSIFDKQGLLNSQTIHIAGEAVTSAIAASLGDEQSKNVDDIKRQIDVESTKDAASDAARAVLQELFQEVAQRLEMLNTRQHIEVAEVICIGGTSQMKGLAAFAAHSIVQPVKVGKPLLLGDTADGIAYLEAIGLAYRSLSKNWNAIDPAFALIEKGEKQKKERPKKQAAARKEKTQTEGTSSHAKKQLFLLLSIVILGVVLVGLLVFVQHKKRNERADDQAAAALQMLDQLPKTESLIVEEPIEQPVIEEQVTTTTTATSSTITDTVSTTETGAVELPIEGV